MSRILVLGAGGMLGHRLCRGLDGHRVTATVRGPADALAAYPGLFDGVDLIGGVNVLEGESLERTVCEVGPEVVVNCIGIVKQLDEADDPYLAIAINSLLPHRLVRVCAQVGARLVHVSTDCVFDGARGGYREDDPTDALDLYGRSKALGETGPEAAHAVTLRTSFIGRELKRPTHGLVEWFLAQRGGAVDGYARVIYSGLTSLELTGVIRRVIESRAALSGVYQVASEPVSKYDLLRLIRRVYGLDVEIRRAEEPVSDRSMAPDLFRAATGYSAPSWDEMIRRMHEDETPYDSWSVEGNQT